MHKEAVLQANQPFTESVAATQGHEQLSRRTNAHLAEGEEEEDPPAPQRHNRHGGVAASDHPMQASSASVTADLTQQHAQLEVEDSLLMQRQDSHGSATVSGASQSSSSSSSSSGSSSSRNSTEPSQDTAVSSGVQAGGSDVRSSYNSSTIWKASSIDQEVVNSNATGMQISFLGTASSVDCKSRFCLCTPLGPSFPYPPPPSSVVPFIMSCVSQ